MKPSKFLALAINFVAWQKDGRFTAWVHSNLH